jgi:hypothetical protein
MHQGIFAIEGWGNPSHVRSVIKKIGKIIERLGRVVELSIKHAPLGQNMIKFEHDGL